MGWLMPQPKAIPEKWMLPVTLHCCIYFLVQAVRRNQIVSIVHIRSLATPALVYIYCYVTLCAAPTNAIYGYHRTHPIHYFHWLWLYPSLYILPITFPAQALFMGLVHILHIPVIASAHIHHFIQIYDPRITFVPKNYSKFLCKIQVWEMMDWP